MSIKKNYFYSSILTVSNYIFPILVFPYISRKLGVDKIGVCNFIDSVINYCILIAMMGINTLGIRICAKYKNNQRMLDASFSNLLIINSVATLLMLSICLILTFSIPKLYIHRDMMFIGCFKILFSLFAVEWFFRGVENFKYVTSRGIIIKFLYVISVFIFIKKQEDYVIYYMISVGMVVVNSIIDINYVRRYIDFKFNVRILKMFIKPFLVLGFYTLLTSMYTSFNVSFLGFSAGVKEVGYYTTAIRLYSICLSLFSAFTGVMLPRMSILVTEKKNDEIKRLIEKSYDILFSFSLPIIAFTTFFSEQIIRIISGKGFNGAILPMKIVMPLMIVIGIEQILIIQLLMPLNKDRAILINSIVGATVGIIMNILLVPIFKSIGSSFALVISEISVLVTAQFFVQKFLGIKFPFKAIAKNILYILIPLLVICLLCEFFFGDSLVVMVCTFLIGCTYFSFIQIFVFKNSIILGILKKMNISIASIC